MRLEEDLQIIIPTYNRAPQLLAMLNTLLSETSPVKSCEIKIIDNASTDGTVEVCADFSGKYPNVKIVRNPHNLGLSGNFIRAMELADKKYFWIVFDNDKIDFTNWAPIEKALVSDEFDFVLTTNYYLDDNPDWAQLLIMMIYLPALICKTENITDGVMANAYIEAYTMHPQMSLISKLVNENKKYYIPKHSIWFPVINPEPDYTFNRIPKQDGHFRVIDGVIVPNLFNCLQSIKDAAIREKSISLLFKKHNNCGPFMSFKLFFSFGKKAHPSHLFDCYVNGTKGSKKILRKVLIKLSWFRFKQSIKKKFKKAL